MTRPWSFLTTCVGVGEANLPRLLACIADERQVTYRTFRAAIGGAALDEWAEGMGYGRWLRLRDDYHVRFYRSKWDGAPALVIDHSAIEHIWVRP